MTYGAATLAFALAANAAVADLPSTEGTAGTMVPAASDAPPTEDAPELDGRKLLLDCEKQFLKLESVKGTIRDRVLQHDENRPGEENAVQETQSDFVYKRFDRVRFENLLPVPHSVIWNGKNLWVWSPQENSAIEESAANVPLEHRVALSLQPGFGIDLLAPIPLDEYRTDVKKIVGPAASQVIVTLTPVDSATPRATMQLVVDPERRVVTRILSLVGEGVHVSDIQLSEFVEASPGIWFPRRVHTRALGGDGTLFEQLRAYERLKFDVPVEDSQFEFRIPEGAKVVPLSNLRGSNRGG